MQRLYCLASSLCCHWDAWMEHLYYHGDNLEGLGLVAEKGIKVDLVYIDPPFATNNEFLIDADRANTVSASGELAYADTVQGDDYLQQLRLRLEAIRRVMAEDGSIYVHIDVKMEHHVRLLLDEVFGARNFRNSITRIKCNPKNFVRYSYGNIKDTILFLLDVAAQHQVAPAGGATYRGGRRISLPAGGRGRTPLCHHTAARAGRHPQRADGRDVAWDAAAGRPPLAVPAGAAGGAGRPGPDRLEQHRQPAQDHLRRRFSGEAAAGRMGVQGPATPQLSHAEERRHAGAHHPHVVGPGDTVLDCYAGSGGTLLEAARLGRRFIGMDDAPAAWEVARERLQSEDVEWRVLSSPAIQLSEL